MIPEVVGAIERTILGVAPLNDCGENGCLICCRIQGENASEVILDDKVDVVICQHETYLGSTDKTLVKVDNPRVAFMRLVSAFFLAKPVQENVLNWNA